MMIYSFTMIWCTQLLFNFSVYYLDTNTVDCHTDGRQKWLHGEIGRTTKIQRNDNDNETIIYTQLIVVYIDRHMQLYYSQVYFADSFILNDNLMRMNRKYLFFCFPFHQPFLNTNEILFRMLKGQFIIFSNDFIIILNKFEPKNNEK